MQKLLAKPTEVAEALGISRSKVYELLASNALPSVRFGKSVRVPLAELERLILEKIEDSKVGDDNDEHA